MLSEGGLQNSKKIYLRVPNIRYRNTITIYVIEDMLDGGLTS